MKRILCLILCICLCAGFSGCDSSSCQDPANYYYRQSHIDYDSGNGIIGAEVHDLEDLRSDTEALFADYFSGPHSGSLESPFPRDTQVVSWSVKHNSLELVMNEEFAVLSGVELSIACACISQTFLDIFSVRQVVIRAEHSALDGNNSITMTGDNLLLKDDVVERLYPTLTLYYMDEAMRYLIGQEISIDFADEAQIISFLIGQLSTQPENTDLICAIPSGAELLNATVNDGICVLDFSEKFETQCFYSTEAQRLTLLAIVNTLTQLDNIQSVEFSVEGNLLAHYGQLTIDGALCADESAIGPVRTALSEFDATLYLVNGSSGYLAAVPTRIRLTTSVTQAELVLQALLAYKPINGFESTIPEGTTVNRVTIRNGICYVDLSGQFLSEPNHIRTAVRSIVASLFALDSIGGVKITVDGTTPDGEYASYFGVLRPASDWYL